MNVLEFLKFLTCEFSKISFSNTDNESAMVFEHITGQSYNKMLLSSYTISKEQQDAALNIIKIRKTGIPLQYILGYTYFYGHKFAVNSSTLIPRPDSEILVSEAIKICRPEDSVLDICCGTGCIGISIAREANIKSLTMIDIDDCVLQNAKQNAKNLATEATFIKQDALDVTSLAKIISDHNIIVSNPPYISVSELTQLEPQVKDFEPKIALLGGKAGTDFYKAIFCAINLASNKPKYAIFEIGHTQAKEITTMTNQHTKIVKDLAGRDRVVVVLF